MEPFFSGSSLDLYQEPSRREAKAIRRHLLRRAYADISVTAANVLPASDASYIEGTAGEAVTVGQTVMRKSSDGKIYKGDANGATNALLGICVAAAPAVNQPIVVQTAGNINPGGTATAGTIYVLSATAGGIAPSSDLASGHTVCILGVATSASNIYLNVFNSEASV